MEKRLLGTFGRTTVLEVLLDVGVATVPTTSADLIETFLMAVVVVVLT